MLLAKACSIIRVFSLLSFVHGIYGQLSGPVGMFELCHSMKAYLLQCSGPTTALNSKQRTICDVTNFGGEADKNADIGAAINKAYTDCASQSDFSTILIPAGEYYAKTPVRIESAQGLALQIDGTIYKDPTRDFTLLEFWRGHDIEVFSKNLKGGNLSSSCHEYCTKSPSS